MSNADVLVQPVVSEEKSTRQQRRRLVNALWQPVIQFKLLMCMLGTSAFVAVLLGVFLYYAFSDMISLFTENPDPAGYYGEMIEIQLIHLFRYCGALFVLYIFLLAAVCVAYTHRLIGPFRPFIRHIDALNHGNYASRINLRRNDLDLHRDYANKLNELAAKLEMERMAVGKVGGAEGVVPEAVEPEVVGPEAVEPEAVEPEAAEPEVAEPEAVEPEAVEPEAVEPEAVEPEAVEPEAVEPEAVEPEAVEPEAAEPEAVEPEAVEPEAAEPEAVEPEADSSSVPDEKKSD